MISIEQFMQAVNFRITEGTRYDWECYGKNAYILDSWDEKQDRYAAAIVFDTTTQEVYEVTVCDYARNRAYRLRNLQYAHLAQTEAVQREANDIEAWDDVSFSDLEIDEDMLEKIRLIVSGEEYDDRVSIAVDLPDHITLRLMKEAHALDITFNQHISNIAANYLNLTSKKE